MGLSWIGAERDHCCRGNIARRLWDPSGSSPSPNTPTRDRAIMILLAHSYFLLDDPKQVERMKPYPPLSTLLAGAILRQRGHEPAFFDAMLAPGLHAFAEALDRSRPSIVGILEDNFNFLTKMCTLRMREATLEMIRMARERGCRVAVIVLPRTGRAAAPLRPSRGLEDRANPGTAPPCRAATSGSANPGNL